MKSFRPLVVRTSPPPEADQVRPQLRLDFAYSCAYCTIAEKEAEGIGFQVDHYWPEKHFPTKKNDYDNLYYSCQPCNRSKGDYFPPEEAPDESVIRIDVEDPDEHLALDGVNAVGTSAKGRLHIVLLDLNCLSLQRIRRTRDQLHADKRVMSHGLRAVFDVALDQLPIRTRTILAERRAKMLALGEKADALTNEYVLRALMRSSVIDGMKRQPMKRKRKR